MECCYPEDCGEFSVTPVLMAPYYPTKCCKDPPTCYPCLPRCHKPALVYCDKKPKVQACYDEDCCNSSEGRRRGASPRRLKRAPNSQPAINYCPTCCQPTCKPVTTKYVMPCYRYEDGRINQPTVLMRRACEVACGARSRQRPFVESSYTADTCGEFHRYHSEDERGNVCFHMEKKPTCSLSCCGTPCGPSVTGRHPCHPCHPCQSCRPCHPCRPCSSSPQYHYADCVHARVADPPRCCFYC